MTGLVAADAAVIAGGFADSLGQALTSPWMLAVPGVLVMLALRWLTGRRSWRMPLVLLPPLPDDGEVGDDTIAEFGPDAETEREIQDLIRKYGDD